MDKIIKFEKTIVKNKVVVATTSTIGIGMISSISFNIIDYIFYLYLEEHLQKFWKQRELTDNMISIVNGGISSSISILIAMYIDSYLEIHFDFLKHPLIDASGIIVGTIIILIAYKIFNTDNKPIIHSFLQKNENEKIRG
jgi:hypothetical protein